MTYEAALSEATASLEKDNPLLSRRLFAYLTDNKGKVTGGFERTQEGEPPLRRLLCALLMVDGGRAFLESQIGSYSRNPGSLDEVVDEVVVGGGIHAAIWCANRSIRPVVLEKGPVIGGPYATPRPVFYLNSRNRRDVPQVEAVPGERGSINRLPGALIQPMDVSYPEYQPQTDLAFTAALNLMLDAQVRVNSEVLSIDSQGSRYVLEVDDGSEDGPYEMSVKRVVIATGPGDPRQDVRKAGGYRVTSFPEFVRRMGMTNDYPLLGWNKAAVIGGGDSAAVTCEFLLGQGPPPPFSNAQRDFVGEVAWIGCKCGSYDEYTKKSRSRYAGLARYMPRGGSNARLFPIKNARALSALPEGEGQIKVRWATPDGDIVTGLFDHVVDCTGFVNNVTDLLPALPPIRPYALDGEPVGKKVVDDEVYLVGPCADLPVRDKERAASEAVANIPENSAALFRYARKTAKLAKSMDRVLEGYDIGQATPPPVEVPF